MDLGAPLHAATGAEGFGIAQAVQAVPAERSVLLYAGTLRQGGTFRVCYCGFSAESCVVFPVTPGAYGMSVSADVFSASGPVGYEVRGSRYEWA